MSEKRLNNTIYIMYLVTENYKKAHSLTTEQFMNLDQKYNIINFVKYNLSILCILHAKWIYFCSNLPAAEGSGSFDRIF